MALLGHDDEELPQSDAQLPHVSGVSAAALSQAFHQGDVVPHFVHHTRILTAWVAISVPLHDLEKLRFAVKIPQKCENSLLSRFFKIVREWFRKTRVFVYNSRLKNVNSIGTFRLTISGFLFESCRIHSRTYMDIKVEIRHVCHAETLVEKNIDDDVLQCIEKHNLKHILNPSLLCKTTGVSEYLTKNPHIQLWSDMTGLN